jgi:16S rRNA (uracil1498-N3)-methyltransferase
MAERFFAPDSLGPGEYHLGGAEAHHLATVRRFVPGDHVTLFNGDGNEYAAEIVSATRKSVALSILSASSVDRELPFPLVVASALPKGDRADYLIEKLTELGVTRFVPLVTARSVVIPKESVVEKFRRAVIEASKQCGRNRLMAIDPPVEWSAFLARSEWPGPRFLLHTTTGHSRLASSPEVGAVVAIGPEGGFTVEEVSTAIRTGWTVASLGPCVLRVETAAVAAAALIALGSPERPQ